MNAVVKIRSGEEAYNRVRPYLENAKTSLITLARQVGEEYSGLTNADERAIFCKRLGWSKTRVKDFAKVGREFDAKQRVIEGQAPGLLNLGDLGIDHMVEITKTKDSLLKKAAKEGMFKKGVSTRQIIKLRETGTVQKPPAPVVTEKDKIKKQLADAAAATDKAVGHVSKARDLMERHNISQVKGIEVRKLKRALRELCAEIAAANPDMVEDALAVLRGER